MARWLLPLLLICAAMFGYALGRPKKPSTTARKGDIPFIKCGVCNQIAEQLFRQISKKQSKIAPKQLAEYEIIEVTENICNMKREEGDWVLHLDIVEDGDKLTLVEHEEEGECNSECKTIERACQEVMGYYDTDVAEFLYKGVPEVSILSKFLCNDLSKVCSVRTPPVPRERIPGEAFIPKPSKDAEMEKILRSMSDMPGASNMKMYSKEDIMNMKGFGNEDDEEEDEEDDELQRVSSEKPMTRASGDWKKSIIDGFTTSFSSMKHHSQRALSNAKGYLNNFSSKIKKICKEKSASKANSDEL
eukprot:TRINITY_DN33116_c0_g1_i1.p1 TRINITY_DN33116_c0_g1~~TRINITY_DN33116_c0_g1_i1.p1  ORF type:complete len:303 (-),score=64.93 TRINITY_DN33116_c0_g1_i1:358-1266(-)